RDFPDWEEVRLEKVVCERSEISSNDNFPIYSLTIQDGVTPKTDRYEREFLVTDTSNAYKLVKNDDFAYNPMNLRFGAIARYSGENSVRVSKYYNVFYCRDLFNSLFFEAYFKTESMISFYDKMSTGSLIEKKRVHFADFLKFKIPVPLVQEQT
ncbi:MAG: restriction endonuclease subunit S, partial [Dolichospermum sp.]